MDPHIEPSWKKALWQEFQQPYYRELTTFVVQELKAGAVIYPPLPQIYAAFDYAPLENVKVVILGQDPYHGPRQANGLCFSVGQGVNPPPSLVNIFKELESDLGLSIPLHGDLQAWARQGVLLLNAVLTVRHQTPASHAGKGWEQFTDAAIRTLSAEREGIVFMLWGKYAAAKGEMIDASKHLVLKAPHPSPYSASSGFFGCKHFSKANAYLLKHGKQAINWDLSTKRK